MWVCDVRHVTCDVCVCDDCDVWCMNVFDLGYGVCDV